MWGYIRAIGSDWEELSQQHRSALKEAVEARRSSDSELSVSAALRLIEERASEDPELWDQIEKLRPDSLKEAK